MSQILLGIEEDYFVIIDEHAPGRYHGYIEKNPKDMPQEFKNALYNAKFIKNVKSYKIIRRK